ncbi:unnamed protein product [Lymnaea stagnalis]|uniref:non-specific serine/threonine protein kinase n=1 Tax=Lymnaea stagnalis TaxID=6523 RepID=A0AAV2HGM8_LYMST
MRNEDKGSLTQSQSMQFHLTHGSAISLTEGQTTASRSHDTFCNGIIFSDQPVKVNEKICVELGCITAWSGALRVGVTSVDPGKLHSDQLPRFAYPDLVSQDGYWLRVINENLTAQGCRLMVYFNTLGHLQLFINGQHKGTLLSDLPVNQKLWLLLDIYGNTCSAKIVPPDDVPREILARGSEAVEAYEQACTSGTQPVYRARLMLVGQERVGKTSLKRALTGQSHNIEEASTDGIDLSASCSFTLNNQSSWKLAIKGDETARREKLQDSIDLGVLGTAGLEEEYNHAIATNIAQELLALRRKDGVAQADSTATSTFTPLDAVVNKDIVLLSNNSGHPTTIHMGVPDKIATLVQEIIEQKEGSRGQTSLSSNSRSSEAGAENVVLNIWDFAGHAVYYTTHQVFLTSRAVYCIVFNLCDDLNSKPQDLHKKNGVTLGSMSTLEYMDFWMRSIHAHAAENTRNNIENTALAPPIFLVGTHRNGLDPDPTIRSEKVEAQFALIREFLIGKPYTQHVVLPFHAVENNMSSGEDEQIDILRAEIGSVASKQPYVGELMPIKWLRFEQEITAQADAGVNFATYNQVYEIAVNQNILKSEVHPLLNFYHDLGMLIYYGSHRTTDPILCNTVVLNPQWLVNMFKQVTAGRPQKNELTLITDKWMQLINHGVLEESLLPFIWTEPADHHNFLLGLMTKFDLICPRLPPSGQTHRYASKSWYVPMRFGHCEDKKEVYVQTVHDARFYIDFNGFLPDGLFHRLQARAIHWSQEHGGRDLYLAQRIARLFVDPDHDLLLEMAPSHFHRIKVLVMHVKDKEATSAKRFTSPVPEVVAKVRNFLEGCLVDLRVMWMKRLAYKMCFSCPCDKVCKLHEVEACTFDECLHLLDLNECLTSQVVCCEHRRVKTESFKKWFPVLNSNEFREPIIVTLDIEQGHGNIERHFPSLPSWLKGAAKLLNGAPDNHGWFALARLMGYKQNRIDLLNEDMNPSLALLTDWIVSSGNTTMSVDVLLHYLQQLGCHDVIDVITRAKDFEFDRPQVFLSYQWDVQDEVAAIRNYLERSGYSCWMDIGQMGGGDQLSNKIDQGLRGCKAVLACITPKYIASHLCNRELWLADMLQKPIIPVVMETVSWPPPGGMAVILSQLVYINMKGIGGHGGTGVHADLMDKYAEIVQRVSLYASPDLTPCVDATVLPPPEPELHSTEPASDPLSGYRTSMSGSLSEMEFQRPVGQHEPSLDVTLSRYGDVQSGGVVNANQHNSNNSSSSTAVYTAQSNSRRGVPRANVKQCAVCALL